MLPPALTPPISTSEGVAVAEAVMRVCDGRQWEAGMRGRLQSLLPALGLRKLRVYAETLVADPQHSGTFYVLVEGANGPWVLHIAPATAGTSAWLKNPTMLARVRPTGEREIVLNAVDAARHVETLVRELYPEMMGRPTGVHSIWSCRGGVVEFLRGFPKRPGWMAGIRSQEPGWGVYLDVLRAGWRDGLVVVREGLRQVPERGDGYSRFCYVVNDRNDARKVVDWCRGLAAAVQRSHDVELDLRELQGLEIEELQAMLDHLKQMGIAVQSVELPEGIHLPAFAMALEARQTGLTVSEDEPLTRVSGLRMHWKREA